MWCLRIAIIFLTLRLVLCQKGNTTEEEKILRQWKSLEKTISKAVSGGIKAIMPIAMSAVTELKLSSECQSSLAKLLFGLIKLRTWSFEMLDSFGKPAPGIMTGTLAMYGNYEQCVNLKAMDDKNIKELFRGSYCSVDIHLSLPPKPDHISLYEPMEIFKNFTKEKDTVVRFLARIAQLLYSFNFRYDICIPSKCHKEDIQAVLDYVISELDIITMNVSWCDIRENVDMDWACIICTWSIAVVIIIVVAATIFDISRLYFILLRNAYNGMGKKRKFVLAFSMYKNWKKLTSEVNDKRIEVLHGLRLLSVIFTIVIATLLNFDFDIFSGLFSLFYLPYWTSAEIILHGTLYVDTLFLISGITVMYTNIPREDSKDRRFHVIAYILRRLFRIIPTYLFVMACVIVLSHQASGPMWNQTAVNDANLCREHWWENIIFINNFVSKSDELCLQNSWYVATDFQLYLIALIIIGLIVVWRSPIWAAFVACILSVAGMMAAGILTFIYEYKPTILIAALDIQNINNYQDVLYHKPHDHIAPFCVGLAIGYMFVKRTKLKMPQHALIFGWVLSTCVWSSILFGITPWNQGNFPSDILGSIFSATHRISWAASISWVAVTSYYGYGGIINYVLSHRIAVAFSRLSFTTMLGFTICYNIVFGFYRTHIDINRVDFVLFAIGYLAIVFGISFLLYMLIDAPIIALKNLIFYHPLNSAKEKLLPMEHVNGTCAKRAINLEKVNARQRICVASVFSTSSGTELHKTERKKPKEFINYRL